jgi:uncharacterized membrane protein YwzB
MDVMDLVKSVAFIAVFIGAAHWWHLNNLTYERMPSRAPFLTARIVMIVVVLLACHYLG